MSTPRKQGNSGDTGRQVSAVRYSAPEDYALDVELYPIAELKRRVGDPVVRGLERIDFHCLIHVTAGRYAHMVDFETQSMAPGSLLLLTPGQVHRFGELSDCDGWLLVFKAELLPARTDARPASSVESSMTGLELIQLVDLQSTHVKLSVAARRLVQEAFVRMADDARRPASRLLNLLLRSQVQTLLLRLQLESAPAKADDSMEPAVMRRYRRYRADVEANFRRWHSVAPYAARQGCSEKSLARAAMLVTARSAKAVLTERLVLEAKRLLAHSALPIASIGDQLGFAEATNFVKFFRRESGLTPGAFRANYRRQGSSP